MNNDQISNLLEKAHNGTATPGEWDELIRLIRNDESGEVASSIDRIIQSRIQFTAEEQDAAEWVKIANTVLDMDKVPPVVRMRTWKPLIGWAAAIAVLMGVAAYFYTTSPKAKQPLVQTTGPSLPTDILPGGNRAQLTLSDGTLLSLDSATNGVIARQGNAAIVKLANGAIAYDLKGAAQGAVMMNTMTTPKGGQYRLSLPDGTKVWLNAASSISFPTAFTGHTRNVSITGEVYFEVVTNKAKPFVVTIHDQNSVEVLGTSFNINSYADEGTMSATLLEGSIRVSDQKNTVMLVPNQQATLALFPGKMPAGADYAAQSIRVNGNVDMNQVMAWKNGLFSFENADIRQVMKQLERWYNIDVKYEGEIPAIRLRGKMDRGAKLSGILQFLTDWGVKTRLESRTLIIYK